MPAFYSIPLKQGATFQQVFQLLQQNGTPVPGISGYAGTHKLEVRTAPIAKGGTLVTTGTLTVTDAANAKIQLAFSVAQARLINRPEYVYAAELVKVGGEVWVAMIGDFSPLTYEIAQ